jgi:uncharacterized protein YkwD
MVDGRWGPEVAALFPLFVGVAPPALPVRKLYREPALGPDEAEARLLALVNQARRAAGVAPLALHPTLARAARLHARDMQRHGFFGHRSPARGDLAARLAAEELAYATASENLALSSSAQRAHEALLASPSHRKNLLDPRLTHLGVGAALHPRAPLLYISECFARLE